MWFLLKFQKKYKIKAPYYTAWRIVSLESNLGLLKSFEFGLWTAEVLAISERGLILAKQWADFPLEGRIAPETEAPDTRNSAEFGGRGFQHAAAQQVCQSLSRDQKGTLYYLVENFIFYKCIIV